MGEPNFVTIKGHLEAIGPSTFEMDDTLYSMIRVDDQLYKNVAVGTELKVYFNVGDDIELHCVQFKNCEKFGTGLIAIALRHPETGRMIRSDYAKIRKKITMPTIAQVVVLLVGGLFLSVVLIGILFFFAGLIGLIRLPSKLPPPVETVESHITNLDRPPMARAA